MRRVKAQTGAIFSFLRKLFVGAVREFLQDESPQTAAAISYYVLFSLFPLLIFVVGALGLVLQDADLQEDVIDLVLENIPLTEDEGRNTVRDAVEGVAGAASGGLGVIGLLGMGWSASAMFGVIRRALNKAYAVERRRPFVQQKLVDLAMVAGLAVFFLTSISATAVLRIVRDHSEELARVGELAEAMGFFWDLASFLLPLAFSFIAFAVLYTVVPAERRSPADVWPGALFAAAVFEAGKLLFSVYLENFGNYDVVFGSLGAVAAFLFWVYISANILLLGAQITVVYRALRAGEYAEARPPGPKRPLREKLWRTAKGLFVHVPEEKPDGRAPERTGARGRPE